MKSVKGRGGLTHGRGMHDTVQHIWTNTMTDCASIHFAMSAVTGFSTSMSDHVEVAAARSGEMVVIWQKSTTTCWPTVHLDF